MPYVLALQEITFRHLYATQQPSLEQRRASWENYVALFKVILESKVNMQVSLHAASPVCICRC